jgi:methyl-accepting chemotaxis protein
MAFLARLKQPSVRMRVATLSGVMVLGFAVIGAVFQTGRSEVEQALVEHPAGRGVLWRLPLIQ